MDLKNLRFDGYIPSEPDERDFTLSSLGIETETSDQEVVEIELLDYTYDQGRTDMCTAYASAYFMSLLNKTSVKFSPIDSYGSKLGNSEGETGRNVMKNLHKRGIAPFSVYGADLKGDLPYARSIYFSKKEEADFNAQLGRISHYYRVMNSEEHKKVYELGLPTLLGIKVYENFIPDENGVCPPPKGNLLGGHMIVGGGKKPGYTKIKNSWSKDWGIDGCAWIPDELIIEIYGAIDFDTKVKNIQFQVGTDFYAKNGKRHYMTGIDEHGNEVPVYPFIKDGRTYVPLRFVAEALGAEVEWWPAAQVIYIKE